MPKFSECWRCRREDTSVVCSRCLVAKYCSNTCKKNDGARHKPDCDAVNKTCEGCGKTASNLVKCLGCLNVFYCDANCQRKNWPEHKKPCKEVRRKIESISLRMSTSYPDSDCLKKICFWSRLLPAYDCLNLGENEEEGYDYKKRFNVLSYSVEDLRNVAVTCAALPANCDIHVMFTLNGGEPCGLAKIVLFLYMLIKGESGIEKTVIEIWYSILLSEKTYLRLTSSLCELAALQSPEDLKSNTKGLVRIDKNHLTELKLVWQAWLNLPVMGTTWIQDQRKSQFENDPDSAECAFGIADYYQAIPPEHVTSAKKWMKDGVFSVEKLPVVAENPTLTGSVYTSDSTSFCYCIESDTLPVSAWDYIEIKKFNLCDSLVDMYGGYIENALKQIRQKASAHQVNFQAVLGNCMEIGNFLKPTVKYDRILTSNLVDYIHTPHLLQLCSERLDHTNAFATIVTETHSWTSDFCPEADVLAVSHGGRLALLSSAMEDTGQNAITLLKQSGTSIREYNDNSSEFLAYLRASFHARDFPSESKFPGPGEFGNKVGLRLRNYKRNENRLVFFKLNVNCRRVSLISGLERSLEWVPL